MKKIKSTGSLSDLVTEKKNQQILRQENETLQAILTSLGEGVIVADKNGKFLFFNPMAKKILGIGSTNVTLSMWATAYGAFYPDQVTPYPSEQLPLARAIKGENVFNELIFIKNPERPEGVFIEVSANPLRNCQGAITGGTVILRDITNINQAKTAQKHSEERVKAQFKGFPIPTYVWQYQDNDFVLVDYNNAAAVITKNMIDNFLGQKSSAIYADAPEIQADFMKCYTEKTRITREMLSYRLRTTNENKEMIFSYVFVPPDLVLLHTEDITEQKENIAKLRRLSKVVEQTADSVIITNQQGVIEYVNPAFEATTGYSLQEVVGQTPKILQSGMHDRAFYNNLWRIIRSGNPYRGTIVNKKKTGELYWSEQTITPMKDDTGIITNFVSVLKDITELKQKQEQEFQLRIARELQQRYYKVKVTVPGFDVAGATYSAVETSGDYFDFIPMQDGSIGIVISDVSGHGIGPALIMAQTRAYLRAFARMESDPVILLASLNRELTADLDQEHFVTMLLARLNPATNSFEYASAGHQPGYLLTGSGVIKQVLESTGIPLGFLPNYQFAKSESIKLVMGDTMIFFTDGLSEAHSINKTQFGFDQILETVRSCQELPARQVIEQLYQAVRSFSQNQPQEDDITAIVCKVQKELQHG